MIRLLAAVILAGMVMGAGPATKPSTRPTMLVDRVGQLEAQVSTLEQEVQSLRQEILELKGSPQVSQPNHPNIEQAVKDHRLTVGMSLAEVRRAMNYDGKLIGEADGVATYKFLQCDAQKIVQAEFEATFRNGILTRYIRLDEPIKMLGPKASPSGINHPSFGP